MNEELNVKQTTMMEPSSTDLIIGIASIWGSLALGFFLGNKVGFMRGKQSNNAKTKNKKTVNLDDINDVVSRTCKKVCED